MNLPLFLPVYALLQSFKTALKAGRKLEGCGGDVNPLCKHITH